MIDGVNQILFGRSPVSSLDGLVSSWRSNGGDQIRSEYEKAFGQ
jgi:putative aldouronate transport system substrate-binding protein